MDVRTLALALLLLTSAQGQASCPQGTYSAWGENRCCTSKCGPGTYIVQSCSYGNPEDTVCEDCGVDYYNPYPDQFHCRRKDLCTKENEEIKIPGNSTADNECQCKIGFHNNVAELCLNGPVCPPGSGATRTGECETCPHGTFSNLTSHVQPCILWQSCGMFGFLQLRPGTSTSDAVCISHPIDPLLPTERPEIIPVTTADDANNTDNINGGRPTTWSKSTIIGMSVGVPVTVILLVLVLILVLRCRRENRRHIDLENGQHPDNKPPPGQQETGAGNTNDTIDGVGTEMEPLTGEYRHPIREERKQAACPPDDGIESGDDTSMSDSLSTLSREGGAEPDSDVEETNPKMGTMQYSHLIAVNEATIDYIVDHLGNMYLQLARCLPLRQGCSFTPTDLDSLRQTSTFHYLREAIRETVEKWKSKQGEEASLEGLLVGLTACGRHDMVEDLCRLNNARRLSRGEENNHDSLQ
eukprot:XP_002597557.1 hypothetical protein BRAFLDRAFT_82338 [Branchiostoma floridae]